MYHLEIWLSFIEKEMWFTETRTYPRWNLGSLTGEGQGARQIFDAAHDVENRFKKRWEKIGYQKNIQDEHNARKYV